MKVLNNFTLIMCMVVAVHEAHTQDQQIRIDSLANLLKTAGREWNDYANPLIEIGEPAVPALIKVAEERNLNQWNRRITIMTLNDIHSEQWIKPALKILFDQKEDAVLRNQVTAGLKGFNLSNVKEDLWKLYTEAQDEYFKLNLAYLLLTADTSSAYRSFHELYNNYDGFVQKMALFNLVCIRPEESTTWYLDGIQMDDWMTANMAMDSLAASNYFVPDDLISLYNESGTREEIRWRIIFVFSHRNEPGSVPILLKAFQEESWLVHTEAAVGLSRFSPEQVIPEMKALKNDSRPFVRNNSRWVIHQMKDR
ncbi:MAG: hypothetical protein AMS27_13670 [Bacteroides sp. SM23_62_1]|nr:MAG: hypothetical protein AMS27_13670 [Bacteroides sp. SM23_62_1]